MTDITPQPKGHSDAIEATGRGQQNHMAVPNTSLLPGTERAPKRAPLPLTQDRDESVPGTAVAVDPVMAQAKRDIDAAMVDTDMHATPGLDAALRAKLVPGPGGQTPGSGG